MVENTDEAAATGGEMQEGQAVGHRKQMEERRPVRLASLGIRFFLTAVGRTRIMPMGIVAGAAGWLLVLQGASLLCIPTG